MSEDRAESVPRAVSSRFKLDNAGVSAQDFINNNTAENTKKSNKTVTNSFSQFMGEFHAEEKRGLDQLPSDVLGPLSTEFFQVINQENGQDFNASTLETYYRAFVRILSERDIHVSSDPNFKHLRKVVDKRQKQSCQEGQIPGKNASDVIPAEVPQWSEMGV